MPSPATPSSSKFTTPEPPSMPPVFVVLTIVFPMRTPEPPCGWLPCFRVTALSQS